MSDVQLVLRHARPPGAWRTEPVDVVVVDGTIVAVGPGAADGVHAARSIEADGALVSPAFVEAHWHADKFESLTDADLVVPSGPERVRAIRARYTEDDVAARAERGLRLALAWGVTRARVTVDTSPAVGLTSLRGVRRAAAALDGLIDVEIVAFPEQVGLRDPDAAAVVSAALDHGAHVVGAYPNGPGDPAEGLADLDAAFDVAEARGLPLDVHVDEEGAERLLGPLAERVLARGLGRRVLADHCVSLEALDDAERARTIDLLARAGMAVCLMPNNLLWEPRARGGLAARAELTAAGVAVAAGTDNAADAFVPYGNLDPVERAFLATVGGAFDDDDDAFAGWATVTTDAARALGKRPGAVAPGEPADLVVLHGAEDVAGAMRRLPGARTTIRRGVPVAGIDAAAWVDPAGR